TGGSDLEAAAMIVGRGFHLVDPARAGSALDSFGEVAPHLEQSDVRQRKTGYARPVLDDAGFLDPRRFANFLGVASPLHHDDPEPAQVDWRGRAASVRRRAGLLVPEESQCCA